MNHEAEAGGREQGGRLAEMEKELSLTPEQVEKISAALHASFGERGPKFDPKKAEEHIQAFSTAFVSDNFDAKTLSANANSELSTHGAKRHVLFLETVTPLLTAEQRTKLAEHLREHSTHPAPAAGK